jgi:hypothetical protein
LPSGEFKLQVQGLQSASRPCEPTAVLYNLVSRAGFGQTFQTGFSISPLAVSLPTANIGLDTPRPAFYSHPNCKNAFYKQ